MSSDEFFLALVIAATASGVPDPVMYAQNVYDEMHNLGRVPNDD
jgi:hypothetical protein